MRTRPGHGLTPGPVHQNVIAMFDTAFLAGLAGLALTFALALWVASATGLDPTLTLVGFAAGIWALFWLIERRIRPDPSDAPTAIRVDWAQRLTETTFDAEGDETKRDLDALGHSPHTAIGQRMVFATEHESAGGDIWFEGTFEADGDGRIIIRATDPV